MFLKYLKIIKDSTVIRNIEFRKGINLIVDESKGKITGNSVGKTTVLKLIDFCFGAKKNIIWEDPENKKQEYALVKNFLIENNVVITLCLIENFDNRDAQNVIIERNFQKGSKKIIRKINSKDYTEEEFGQKLKEIFFPEHSAEKPTFRQIISHNIRYTDLSLNNTLRTLDSHTTDAEYETLHLFLLDCEFTKGNNKQQVLEKIKQEDTFKKRLEKKQSKSEFEATLSLIEQDIKNLNKKKSNLNINDNFENDLNDLNNLKYRINKLSSEIGNLNIRKDLIIEAKDELESGNSNIDLQQLKKIYEQASTGLEKLHKTFEDLVKYHNQMLSEKIKFITSELPQLEEKISEKQIILKSLLKQESELTSIISKSDSYEALEELISELNEKYRLKGEYENTIDQLNEVDNNLKTYNIELKSIDEELFSDEFENTVKIQINIFNNFFTSVSEVLYNERYALSYKIITNKNGQRVYKFSTFVPLGPNIASGKKQGEISSFDIAYTLFADEENIPCMHFVLNDKKELMHDNQLIKIAQVVNKNNIQFVASILKDKLPEELNKKEYYILELSEDNKLFKIENG